MYMNQYPRNQYQYQNPNSRRQVKKPDYGNTRPYVRIWINPKFKEGYNNKKRYKIHRNKKPVIVTIASIIILLSILNIVKHETHSPIDTSQYDIVTMSVPTDECESIEQLVNLYYNEDLYDTQFGSKKKYIEKLSTRNINKNNIEMPIMIDKNNPDYQKLKILESRIQYLPKWIENYKAENGDSIWYYREQGTIPYVRDVNDTLKELQEVNGWSDIPQLMNGQDVIIYNPDRVNLEREYYKLIQNILESSKMSGKTK